MQVVKFTLEEDQKINQPLKQMVVPPVRKPTQDNPYDAYLCFNCHRLHNNERSWQRHWRGEPAKPDEGKPGRDGCAKALDHHISGTDEATFLDKDSPYWLSPSQVSNHATNCVHQVVELAQLFCSQKKLSPSHLRNVGDDRGVC